MKNETKNENASMKNKLPETPRIEQVKMLFNESVFKFFAFIEAMCSKVSAVARNLFDMLPISERKKPALKKLLSKLFVIFSVIFTVFFIFIWLNPLLGYLAIVILATVVFYWPDIAFRYRQYKKMK